MDRIVAVLDRDTALGFRLSGVEVRKADTMEELQERLEELLREKNARLVILDEEMVRRLPEKLERRLEHSTEPLFLPIPTVKIWREAVPPEEYAARLIRRAIGYQIRIRK
ncbi:MAG TPA: V-type ATP synthase subunit F [Nitrospiria bacterium]|nr:V-type ATP synthase subunit F [Nitrospiria bacterium]